MIRIASIQTKEVAQSNRIGWYVRVTAAGEIPLGEVVELISCGCHDGIVHEVRGAKRNSTQ